ncbi:phosphatase PAP2 family protein [Rickettsia endosymbiont of Oedothorax gibbosus]|uniref:phosphatase PAP2 family protein n=1 Tax=Rickettsia endosymbiont of Oedothorax gibbosus TaxID=931099 RepID=UPI0020253189|nr:phosphatase PAP2 family protein [Rickettsia endosymbiont of Oedothorax gibbosus]
MINTNLVYANIFAFGIVLLLIVLFPNFDIDFSNLFYDSKDGFIYRNNSIVQLLFEIIPILTKLLLTVTLLHLIYLIVKHKTFNRLIISGSFYIILSTAIGPGLLVNHLFKEHFGRARPVQIKNFNGSKNFTRAFSISNECVHNCSFSSGHAAMGYSLTSLAYIAPVIYFSRIYSITLIFGSLIGLSRILMGGHFLSDVLASCFFVLIINHILYLCWQKLKLI